MLYSYQSLTLCDLKISSFSSGHHGHGLCRRLVLNQTFHSHTCMRSGTQVKALALVHRECRAWILRSWNDESSAWVRRNGDAALSVASTHRQICSSPRQGGRAGCHLSSLENLPILFNRKSTRLLHKQCYSDLTPLHRSRLRGETIKQSSNFKSGFDEPCSKTL